MSMNSLILFIWFGYLGIMLTFIFIVLRWAVRSGQFSDQDRARYLPLVSPPIDENHFNPEQARDNHEIQCSP